MGWQKGLEVLDLILPRVCVVCEKNEGRDLCYECETKVTFPPTGICCFCGQALEHFQPGVCPSCCRKMNLQDLFIARAYDNQVLKPIVHALKYQGIMGLAQIFGQWLSPLLENVRANKRIPKTLLLIPLPLPSFRLHIRGYNQTELIANSLLQATILDLTLVPGYQILRRRWSLAQANLSAALRQENIAQTFFATTNIQGADILLLDDVCTTGATLAAAAFALRQAGARRIYGLAVAKG